MTENRSLPPAPASCLNRPYASSQKGGTLIAEGVRDLATHERRLADPATYRPSGCLRCRATVHIHDLRPRQLRGDPASATEVIRFRCADRERCGATWQIVPAFLTRHLWRSWAVVERAVDVTPRSPVPARTRRRWHARLASSARLLVALLSTAADAGWAAIVTTVGLAGRRRDLVQAYRVEARPQPGQSLAELAALIHRLAPGVRLM